MDGFKAPSVRASRVGEGGRLIGLDVGTSSVRAVLLSTRGRELAFRQVPSRIWTPRAGWAEQDAEEIWKRVREVLRHLLRDPKAKGCEILGLGVTNQRESVVALDGETGHPLAPVILWQDARTAEISHRFSQGGWGERLWKRAGLPLTTYPSAPKMAWLLENSLHVQLAAGAGRLKFGTLDSWLLFRLRGGHRAGAPWSTDASNASRTLLYDLEAGRFDDELVQHFGIPRDTLPKVKPSWGVVYGETSGIPGVPDGIPVAGDLGDQQASLLGLGGTEAGAAKLTLGTGIFLLGNGAPPGTGQPQGLIRTVLWEGPDETRSFGLEGSVGTAGAVIDWLGPSGLGLVRDAAQAERMARSLGDAGGVQVVPAFAGLYAPRWDPDARGLIAGLSLASGRREICRAVFEGLAHRVADLLEAYGAAESLPRTLWVDGGSSRSTFLLQLIADLSGVAVTPAPVREATARGAALAAGLGVGVWRDLTSLPASPRQSPTSLRPRRPEPERLRARAAWARTLERAAGA